MSSLTFNNIHLRADVDVLLSGLIFHGKVRWKGRLPGKVGSWIGVELNERAGTSNGCYKGVQQFSCPDSYGVFVRASQLRFPPSKGRSCSSYRTVSKVSFTEEALFARNKTTCNADPTKSCFVTSDYTSRTRNLFSDDPFANGRRCYHLKHLVGSKVTLDKDYSKGPFHEPTALNLKKIHFKTTQQGSAFRKSVPGLMVNTYMKESYRDRSNPFISAPSIPKIHKMSSKLAL